jgi:hypothetical protein
MFNTLSIPDLTSHIILSVHPTPTRCPHADRIYPSIGAALRGSDQWDTLAAAVKRAGVDATLNNPATGEGHRLGRGGGWVCGVCPGCAVCLWCVALTQ